MSLVLPASVCAQSINGNGGSVELNGDVVQYSQDGNVIIAEGNVVIDYQKTKLMCDRVEFSRDSKIANAQGNVRLITGQGEISAQALEFNFGTMEGSFNKAKIYAKPYYGFAERVKRKSDNRIVMEDGYVTTSDFDKPEWRIKSKKIEVIPGDRMIARHSTVRIGNLPLAYVPYVTQRLTRKKPVVTFTPGFDKEFGAFLLSEWNWFLNPYLQGTVHLDYREKRDLASGLDVDYRTEDYGEGIWKMYYMNERKITSDRIWEERPSPTIERERYKLEWRHKWQIDDKTSAIGQYYLLSDSDFLKEYFEKEYDEDASPDTFFVMNRILPLGSLSFRIDDRVNRFESKTERLPELRYDLVNQEIAETGLFFQNQTTYSNLSTKFASPSEVRRETMRLDTDNQISYPMKVGFVEFKPFVGGEHTYYSKTKNPERYNSIRGIFRTGASLSTKFYKMFNTEIDKFGLEINQLRHIITPTIDYRFAHAPTLSSVNLDEFDDIDVRDQSHTITFGIENKLQTKRNEATVELLRWLVSVPYGLKENEGIQGFSSIDSDVDFRPTDWLSLFFDSKYDTREGHLDTANFDLYINGGSKWSLGIGKRYSRAVDDQLTTNFNYRFNKKWGMRTYHRFDLQSGQMKEQNYSFLRDLHTWEMEAELTDKFGEGTEIVVVFTLKEFPQISVDFGQKFEPRTQGASN